MYFVSFSFGKVKFIEYIQNKKSCFCSSFKVFSSKECVGLNHTFTLTKPGNVDPLDRLSQIMLEPKDGFRQAAGWTLKAASPRGTLVFHVQYSQNETVGTVVREREFNAPLCAAEWRICHLCNLCKYAIYWWIQKKQYLTSHLSKALFKKNVNARNPFWAKNLSNDYKSGAKST